jgi:Bacterial membrane protein YfhO
MSGRGSRSPLAEAGIAALLFLVLVFAAFWPVVVAERTFFHMDLYYEHLPVWDAVQKALRSSQSPFWLDGEYAGQPLLFHQEAPVLYPPTVPLLLTGVPVQRLADLFTLGHLWLAGFAVYLLVRALTGAFVPAAFGGTAWMLSARMLQTTIWPNAVAGSALVPLVLLAFVRIARGQRRSGIVLGGLAGGLALLAARPHVLLATAPLLLAFAIATVLHAPSRRRGALDLGLMAVLALAIGAPSVAPSAFLFPETARRRGLVAGMAEADVQNLSQGRDLDMVFLPVDGSDRWPESAAYAGILAYALVLSGAYLAARRREPFARAAFRACAWGGVAGLLLAFGSAGPYRLIAGLPVLRSVRVPERFLLSWSLSVAIGSALALAYWLRRARHPGVLAVLCVAGLSADLVWHARRAAPTAQAGVYEIVPSIVSGLRDRLGTDESGFPRRFLSLAASLDPTPYPDTVRQALLREAGALKGAVGMRFGLDSFGGAGPVLFRTGELLFARSRRALALGGVGAVLLSPPDKDGQPDPFAPPRVERAEGLPRAFVVPEGLVVGPGDALRAVLSPALDPRRTVVLEEGEPFTATWAPEAGSVHLVSRSSGAVAVVARLPAPGVLVLLDAWESGWRASVDGAAAPVLRADVAFRAVRLPAGEHRVEFTYVAPGLREGILLGVVGLLGVVLAALRLRNESPRTPPAF